MDKETGKKLYVRAMLEFGPRHPANGALVLLDKDTARMLHDLGLVSPCSILEAEAGR
jgi:hypothetical protein